MCRFRPCPVAGLVPGPIVGLVLTLLLGLLAGPDPARATPSFDCARAATPDEHAICAHRPLALLDDLVAAGHAAVRAQRGDSFLRGYARMLLDARRACGADPGCIEEAQRYAIAAYGVLGARAVPAPAQNFDSYGISQLIRAWGRANGECRGTSDPAAIEAACTLRDGVLDAALRARELCPGVYSLPFADFAAMILVRNHWLPCLYDDLTLP